jgi:pullulanase/glycogen debranching enzyme
MFETPTGRKGTIFDMKRDSSGVWEFSLPGTHYGKYYGYRVSGPAGRGEMFNPNILVGDPYSKAVATSNDYHHQARTLIVKTDYNWGGDTFVIPGDHNRLIIYEAHVRDLTAHPTSGVTKKGTYRGLLEKGKRGGFSHLKDLGINAIELLPCHEFGNIELPYRDSSVNVLGYPTNTWNAYARNHWGYMTSYFFAPESYYATGGSMNSDVISGADGRAVREFKDMVKGFHKAGIAVIMDVVFNHVSQYDYNPLKYIDKFYYFQCDSLGNFIATSGCGNDIRSDRPMTRRLIVDCIKYWMKEYHVDGFRFDLATILDWQTCREIAVEARKINPNVILIAEAWGGGKYDLAGFSDIEWAAWNDRIRNGVKGQNPNDGLGFIFGKFQGENTKKSLSSYITGSYREDGGPFRKKEHSINYLESHDDLTMGDFIRLGTKEFLENQRISDPDAHAKLSPRQLALNKLAAMFLLVSQGPVMLHEGQEFARSKIIAPSGSQDPRVGMIDHNSYDKDNATNYLNYKHRDINRELVAYYAGLIRLRNENPILSSAPKEAVEFIRTADDVQIAFRISGLKAAAGMKTRLKRPPGDMFVVLNGSPEKMAVLDLPEGTWEILADGEKVPARGAPVASKKTLQVPPTSGIVLRKTK